MAPPRIYVSSRVFYEEIADLLDDHARMAMHCGKGEASAALHAMATVVMHRAARDRRLVACGDAPAGVVPPDEDPTTPSDPIPGAPAVERGPMFLDLETPEGLYQPGRTVEVDQAQVLAIIEARTKKE